MTEQVKITKTETVRSKSVDGMGPRTKRQESDATIDLRSKDVAESVSKNKAEKFAEKYGLAIVLMGTMAVAGYIGYKYLDNEAISLTPTEEVCPSDSFSMPGVERGESEFGDWKLDGIDIPANANPTEVYNGWIDSVVDEDAANLLGYAKMVNGFYLNHDNVSQVDKDFKTFLDKTTLEDLTYKSNSLHCASSKAVDIVNYIKSKKVDVSIIENVSEIPGVTIYNTYIKDSVVVENHTTGIDLEGRNALIISYLDEKGDEVNKIGTAGICGNPFTIMPPKPPVYYPPVYYPPVRVIETPKPKLEPKDPSDDVGVNKKVADYKQDDTDGKASRGHKVDDNNKDDGYKNPIGEQKNPVEDAKKAEEKAEEIIEKLEDNHEEVEEEAVVVDKNQSHEESKPLPANW